MNQPSLQISPNKMKSVVLLLKTLLNKTEYFEEISNNDLKISISVIKTSQQLNGFMQ